VKKKYVFSECQLEICFYGNTYFAGMYMSDLLLKYSEQPDTVIKVVFGGFQHWIGRK